MDLHYAIPYATVALGAVLLVFAQFGQRFRRASLWFRSAYLLASLLGILWSILGFFLLWHQVGDHSDLTWQLFCSLNDLKSDVGGVALGIFIALVINPESWKRNARSTSSA